MNELILTGLDGSNPLAATPAFKKFSGDIKDRCEEPPVAVALTNIGAFGFFPGR